MWIISRVIPVCALTFFLVMEKSSSYHISPQNDNRYKKHLVTENRRNVLNRIGSITVGTTISTWSLTKLIPEEEAIAFPNKISNTYDDRPKRRGPQPKDLGILKRQDMAGEDYNGLKNCGPAPNCFCSTDSILDDPEHNIPSWKWPADFNNDVEKAFSQLYEVIQSYKPGQGGIDGGGFQVVTYDPKKGYMYVQFESLKAGYIDDLEFAFIDSFGEGEVQVRSSSRVGYLDFGVNAKRLNYIASSLRQKGWDAKGVDFQSHQDYAIQNSLS